MSWLWSFFLVDLRFEMQFDTHKLPFKDNCSKGLDKSITGLISILHSKSGILNDECDTLTESNRHIVDPNACEGTLKKLQNQSGGHQNVTSVTNTATLFIGHSLFPTSMIASVLGALQQKTQHPP
jgi:hypothetical protein